MPFKKKFVGKKGGKKKMPLRKEVKKIERQIAHLKPEIKYLNVSNPAFPGNDQFSNAVIGVNITSLIAQGTTSLTRVGDRIRMVHFKCTLLVRASTLPAILAGASNNFMRCILIYDGTYRGTSLTGAQVLYSYNLTDGSVANYVSVYNEDFINQKDDRGKNVTVLFDKKVMLNQAAAPYNTTPLFHTFKLDKKLRNRISNYNGANQETGNLQLYLFAGGSTNPVNNPLFSYDFELGYTDI